MFAEHEEGRKAGDIQSQMLEEKLEVNEAAVIGKQKYILSIYFILFALRCKKRRWRVKS